MSGELISLLSFSLVAFLAWSGMYAYRMGIWRGLCLDCVCVLLFCWLLWELFGFPFPNADIVMKGSVDSDVPIVALYCAMTIGMLSSYLYAFLSESKEHRTPWDWPNFFAPLLISPIVFIPVYAAFQGSGIDLGTSVKPRIILLLIAFENGFFGKVIVDSRRRKARGKS